MDYPFRKFLSIFIVLCVLAIGGIAQAQSAEHAGHHAQHQAATHGTVLCSWMCAAGTVLDTEVVLIQSERSSVAVIPPSYTIPIFSELPRISPSRAPPSFIA
ncbi:MAG: hypothetical protein AB7L09_18925 [Nitrospira sp.]|jgi:hypothetical protein